MKFHSIALPCLIAFAAALGLAACETATAPATSAGAAKSAAGSAPTASGSAGISMARPSMAAPQPAMAVMLPPGRDRFPEAAPNKWQAVEEKPVSTFSIDVDTASYAYVRRSLREGRLPPRDAVRVEEMVNYFPYVYPMPEDKAEPFRATATVLPSPWKKGAKLLHIGVKGYDIPQASRPPANLTFLIDVSGSMAPADRLPLIQAAIRQLKEGVRDDDTIAIVTYAGWSGIALEPTKGRDIAKAIAVVDGLKADGSTAGSTGIQQAYALAERMYDPKAVNRVVLATDGDFNVGETDPRRLEAMIAEKRKKGIYLTILGVGTGNLNDALMQRLAQAGNGQAAYLDTLQEARKVWIEELGSTMFPIADDVKIQVEFNPAQVAEYRLIGYETRLLSRADFKDDKVDAGEIGSGHSVTALYEFVPVGSPARTMDPLRYGKGAKAKETAAHGKELAFLKLRYKRPGEPDSRQIETPVTAADDLADLASAGSDMRFAVAVAGFAQLLRNETSLGDWSFPEAAALAEQARGEDPNGWRAELVQLVRLAGSLKR